MSDEALPSGTGRGTDPAFLRFLADRLTEETAAAEGRGSDQGTMQWVGDLLDVVRRGDNPDRMSLGLLTVAYARHPEFRDEWNRWRPTSQ